MRGGTCQPLTFQPSPIKKVSSSNKITILYKQLGAGCSSRCLYFQDFLGSKLLFGCLVVWPSKEILSVFQWFAIDILYFIFHLSLIYCIPLVKNQITSYEIWSLAICINIKAFSWVNRKQLNILKTFLEYLGFYIFAYRGWFRPKSWFPNYVPRASCFIKRAHFISLRGFDEEQWYF